MNDPEMMLTWIKKSDKTSRPPIFLALSDSDSLPFCKYFMKGFVLGRSKNKQANSKAWVICKEKRTRIQPPDHKTTDRIPRMRSFSMGQELLRQYHHLPPTRPYDWYDRIEIGTVIADQPDLSPTRKSPVDDGDVTVTRDSWGRSLLSRKAFSSGAETVLRKRTIGHACFRCPAAPGKVLPFAAMPRLLKADCAGQRILGLFMGSYRSRGEWITLGSG
jgi:hypothetical protein